MDRACRHSLCPSPPHSPNSQYPTQDRVSPSQTVSSLSHILAGLMSLTASFLSTFVLTTTHQRQLLTGYLGKVILVIFYAAPLSTLAEVLKSKSAATIYAPLSYLSALKRRTLGHLRPQRQRPLHRRECPTPSGSSSPSCSSLSSPYSEQDRLLLLLLRRPSKKISFLLLYLDDACGS